MRTQKMTNLILMILMFSATACEFSIPETPEISLQTETPPHSLEPDETTEEPILTLTEIPLPAGYGAHGPWIDIYFTDPENPLAAQETGGPDVPLVKAIDAARLSVDVAVYSMSLRSVRDALMRAHDRGVQVRMVMESDNMDGSAPQALLEAGIPILGDRREGLMHDKFVVIDRSEVWLGSMNFTYSGTYEDNNQLIHIRSVKMAENYTKEFEEMFVDDEFGPDVVTATPNPQLTIDGTDLEVYFSPDDGVAAQIIELLSNAEESIYFMAFSLTTDEFGEIIREKANHGVTVNGVMEEEQVKSNIGTEYDFFKQAKLEVFTDGNEGQMHHKTFIIDEKIVVTGSYNFSRSAEIRNDENIVIIYSEPVAKFFMGEFQRVLKQVKK